MCPRKALGGGSSEVNFHQILSTFGNACSQNGSKNEPRAPRTSIRCPHEGPSVGYEFVNLWTESDQLTRPRQSQSSPGGIVSSEASTTTLRVGGFELHSGLHWRHGSTRWSTTISSNVNRYYAIDVRALCGADLGTLQSRCLPNETQRD